MENEKLLVDVSEKVLKNMRKYTTKHSSLKNYNLGEMSYSHDLQTKTSYTLDDKRCEHRALCDGTWSSTDLACMVYPQTKVTEYSNHSFTLEVVVKYSKALILQSAIVEIKTSGDLVALNNYLNY